MGRTETKMAIPFGSTEVIGITSSLSESELDDIQTSRYRRLVKKKNKAVERPNIRFGSWLNKDDHLDVLRVPG